MSSPSESVKLKHIYHRDQGICWYCGMVVPRGTHLKKLRATRDHIMPISEGGKTTLENLRLAHAYCNSTRMGLYKRSKEEIVHTIKSLMTPKQVRLAQNDIQKNREWMERLQESRARDAEFARRRRAGLLPAKRA
jgi:hypothetical protein